MPALLMLGWERYLIFALACNAFFTIDLIDISVIC